MENPIKMDDLGGKPTIFGNIHINPGLVDIHAVGFQSPWNPDSTVGLKFTMKTSPFLTGNCVFGDHFFQTCHGQFHDESLGIGEIIIEEKFSFTQLSFSKSLTTPSLGKMSPYWPYCWWFRNPAAGMVLKPCKLWDFHNQPQLVSRPDFWTINSTIHLSLTGKHQHQVLWWIPWAPCAFSWMVGKWPKVPISKHRPFFLKGGWWHVGLGIQVFWTWKRGIKDVAKKKDRKHRHKNETCF